MSEHREILAGLLEAICDKLIASEQMLTELDAAIGDGDCGASLKKGCLKVKEKLNSLNNESIGDILKQTAMAFMSAVGGVSGAIYTTALLRASAKIGAKDTLNTKDIHEALEAAMEGIKERGEGTEVGDKTMIDALQPAINVFGKAISDGDNTETALENALEAARKGSDSTIPLVAKKGRASYLGERSVGHRDAGSMVICLVFEAACEYFGKELEK